MLELKAASPLEGLPLPAGNGWQARDLGPMRIGLVRLAPGAEVPAVSAAPGNIESSGESEWVCIGPREWLVLRSEAGIDIGSALFALSIVGTAASALLACGIALDFRDFAPGHATRARLGQIAVILIRDSVDQFRLLAPTPYARYLVQWLDHHV